MSCVTFPLAGDFVGGLGDLLFKSKARTSAMQGRSSCRGKFIIFDGVDGSGKGTLVKMLDNALTIAGVSHVITKQPGGTPFGDEIRRILFETIGTKNIHPDSLELLFLANHIHNCSWIEEQLSSGRWVIADRHWPSAIAYMEARGASKRMQKLYREFRGLDHDLFFLLLGDPAYLLDRAQKRATESHQGAKKWNNVESMEQVQKTFIDEFAHERKTMPVPTDQGLSALDEFRTYIGPALIMAFDLPHDFFDYERLA